MKITNITFLLSLSIVLILSSCSKDDPEIPNEEELITTLTYTLAPTVSGDTVVLSFQDMDGDGGDAPIITEGTLSANTTYTGNLVLLNEQETPAENINEEIKEEDEEHQFFFQSTVTDLNITYNDEDENGNPIGISTTVTTGNTGSGTLTVTLRHEPDKSAAGVASGNISNAGGETDIEVTFTIDVQ